MALTLNQRVWVLAERLYIHAHGDKGHEAFLTLLHKHDIDYDGEPYQGFPITKPLYTFMSEDNYAFATFMNLVPTYKYLPLLQEIIFDPKVKQTQNDNWNYYGEFIRHWYPDLLLLLNLAGISVDSETNHLVYPDQEQPPPAQDFLTEGFGDPFLDYIRKEINESYRNGLFLSVMFLSRKTLETIIIRIFEVVFPKLQNKQYVRENHELWYNLDQGRYLSFDRLLDNLRDHAAEFLEDRDLIIEMISLVRPFKDETNKFVHYDYKIPDEAYINQWRIPKLVSGAKVAP